MSPKTLFVIGLVFSLLVGVQFVSAQKSDLTEYSIFTIESLKNDVLSATDRVNGCIAAYDTFIIAEDVIDIIPMKSYTNLFGKIAWEIFTKIVDTSLQEARQYTINEGKATAAFIHVNDKYFDKELSALEEANDNILDGANNEFISDFVYYQQNARSAGNQYHSHIDGIINWHEEGKERAEFYLVAGGIITGAVGMLCPPTLPFIASMQTAAGISKIYVNLVDHDQFTGYLTSQIASIATEAAIHSIQIREGIYYTIDKIENNEEFPSISVEWPLDSSPLEPFPGHKKLRIRNNFNGPINVTLTYGSDYSSNLPAEYPQLYWTLHYSDTTEFTLAAGEGKNASISFTDNERDWICRWRKEAEERQEFFPNTYILDRTINISLLYGENGGIGLKEGKVDRYIVMDALYCDKQDGVCRFSMGNCDNGEWVGCDYYNIPDYETVEVSCDGLDNDCDGEVDEGCLSGMVIQVSTDDSVYALGETATSTASLKDESENPVTGAETQYIIKNSENSVLTQGVLSETGNGVYGTSFSVPSSCGSYVIEVTALKAGYRVSTDSANFDVNIPAQGHNLELEYLHLDETGHNPGDNVRFTFEIKNTGDYSEDVTGTLTASGPDGYTYTGTHHYGNLNSGVENSFDMFWPIPDNALIGSYVIEGKLTSPSGDEDFSDNKKTVTLYVSGELSEIKNKAYHGKSFKLKPASGYVAEWGLYKIVVVEFGNVNAPTEFITMDVYKNNNKIQTVGGQTHYSYYSDDYGVHIWDIYIDEMNVGGGTEDWICLTIGTPASDVYLSPFSQNGMVGNQIAYTVTLPSGSYTVSTGGKMKAYKCDNAYQPIMDMNDKINWFTPSTPSPSGSFTAWVTPQSAGTLKFAFDSIKISGTKEEYNLFGALSAEHYYDAKVNSILTNPTNPRSGNTVSITSNIANTGSASLSNIEVYTTIFDSEGSVIEAFNKTSNAGNVAFNWDTSDLSSGNYNIRTTISHLNDMDSSNNILDKQVSLSPPPTLQVTAGTDKSEYNIIEEITVTATVTGEGNNIEDAMVTALITKPDGSEEIVMFDCFSGAYNVSHIPYQLGGYNIEVTASREGFIAGTDTITISILDMEPPEISITSGPGGTINHKDVMFVWKGTDNITAPQDLLYSYMLEGYGDWSGWASETEKIYTNLPDGSYTFRVRVKDEAGNIGNKDVPFTIDALPTITIQSPENKRYNKNEIDLDWSVDEEVFWAVYSLNGEENQTDIFPTLDELSDSSKEKNLTFSSAGSQLVYIKIPKHSDVTKVGWILTGHYYVLDATYQEFETSHWCGPGWSGGCECFFDGDWTTTTACSAGAICELEVKYSTEKYDFDKVYFTTYESKWTPVPENITIPDDCMQEGINSGNITIRLVSDQEYETGPPWCCKSDSFTCWNGTNWKLFFQHNPKYMLIEEAIWWLNDISYPQTITIDIGDDGVVEHTKTGEFKSSETVNLNTEAINNYLSICTADENGNCLVPVEISSDTAGTIEISNIDVRYLQNTSITVPEGPNELTLCAEDTTGNANCTIVHFTVDTIAPVITIHNPINREYYSTNIIGLEWSVNEETAWSVYSLNSADNATLNGNTTIEAGDGNNELTVCAGDASGNTGCKTIHFTIGDSSNMSYCDRITSPGVYYLRNNLTYSSGHCIHIVSEDVVFDCMGHSISYIGQGVNIFSVYMTRPNITVRNCFLDGKFRSDIAILGASQNSRIEDCTINNMSLWIEGANYTATNITFTGNPTRSAITLFNTQNSIVENIRIKVIESSSDGSIQDVGGSTNNIYRNIDMDDHTNYHFRLSDSYGLGLYDSNISKILFLSASDAHIERNKIHIGIHILSSTDVIENVTFTKNVILGDEGPYESIMCWGSASDNDMTFYDNIINSSSLISSRCKDDNFKFSAEKTLGTNTVGGPFVGGNFWANPDGTGFSEQCNDTNHDGVCDSAYEITTNSVDYFPLTFAPEGSFCGNGVVESNEECDDSNTIDGDGCSSVCTIECTPEPEICDGLDNDCDGVVDNGGDALCDDGMFCNGQEICAGELECQAGTPPDCSVNDLLEIATCSNFLDNNSFTWDYFAGFTSVCNEETDRCTADVFKLTHTCSVDKCEAECDEMNECEPNSCSETYSDYCDGLRLVEYDDDKSLDSTEVNDSCENNCLEDCTCTECSVDCSPPETTTNCVRDVCGAKCDLDEHCPATECNHLDGCYNGTYRDYQNVSNTCSDGCECTENKCSVYNEIITDNDGDGYDIECDADCNDNNAGINPGAEELCDKKDNDCDNLVDEDGVCCRWHSINITKVENNNGNISVSYDGVNVTNDIIVEFLVGTNQSDKVICPLISIICCLSPVNPASCTVDTMCSFPALEGSYRYSVTVTDKECENVSDTYERFVIPVPPTPPSPGLPSPPGSGGGGYAKPTRLKLFLSNIMPEEPASMEIDSLKIPLRSIEIGVKKETGKVSFEFKPLGEKPSDTPEPPAYAHGYFEVHMDGLVDSNLKGVKVKFKANKTWMEENGFDSANLARYSGGFWEEFPGTVVGEDDTYIYYETTIPGFSLFAVTGNTVLPEEPGKEEPTTLCTPGAMRCFGSVLKECSFNGMDWGKRGACQVGRPGININNTPPSPRLTGLILGTDPTLVMLIMGIIILTGIVLVFRFKPF